MNTGYLMICMSMPSVYIYVIIFSFQPDNAMYRASAVISCPGKLQQHRLPRNQLSKNEKHSTQIEVFSNK